MGGVSDGWWCGTGAETGLLRTELRTGPGPGLLLGPVLGCVFGHVPVLVLALSIKRGTRPRPWLRTLRRRPRTRLQAKNRNRNR